MNRIEFMNQLEQLLADIPAEERQEALEFYTNYFEDAGEENEDQILKELGSPERVARTIKDDLSANGEYSKNGEYTEHGYKDAGETKDSIIKVEPSATEEQTTEGNTNHMSGSVNLNKETQNQNNQNQAQNQNGYAQNQQQNQNQYQNQNGYNQNQGGQFQYQYGNQGNYGQNPYQNQGGYNQGQNPYPNQNGYAQGQNQYGYQKPAKTNVALLILVCVFAIPCIIPMAIACFSTVFGLVIGFGAAGVGCTVAGFAVVLCGIAEMASVPAIGIVGIGGGLICFGLGILFIFLTTLLAKLIPAICKAFGAIFRAPFGGRRVAA